MRFRSGDLARPGWTDGVGAGRGAGAGRRMVSGRARALVALGSWPFTPGVESGGIGHGGSGLG